MKKGREAQLENLQTGAPFVLCEDARPDGDRARLFTALRDTIVVKAIADVPSALDTLRDASKRGLHAAGWISYEAGLAFELRLMQRAQRPEQLRFPLLWFGLFEDVLTLSRRELELALPDPDGAWLSPPRPRVTQAQHSEAFARARDYIAAGDIYQVNLSHRADVTVLGHPLAAYARLRKAGQGGWSAVVFDGASWLLSTSPELFFRLSGRSIEAKPMKGTAKRGLDVDADRLAKEQLRGDPKELAENVMIVDLLRNDISKLAKRGTVHVPELFSIETYPTLHTLTSTVRAEIKDEYDAVDALRALFPCGSVTGAPKIRAMEIIRELEGDERGPYTGSIGWIAPDGDAEFNVAIRTLALDAAGAELGLGSAVVFDSTAENEWAECATKGAFVSVGAESFDLLETMRFDPPAGVGRLPLHLARLGASARTFGFVFDEDAVTAALMAAVADTRHACVIRLSLSPSGAVRFETRALPATPDAVVEVAIRPLPVSADDFRLRHKTSSRHFYDSARVASGAYEAVFVDAAGFLTEGSFTNVFVERGGALITPPAERGLLPGILRQALLMSGRAREGDLVAGDLASGFYLGNAVRGLVPAQLLSAHARQSVRSAV